MPNTISRFTSAITSRLRAFYRRIVQFIEKWPLRSFFVLLALLLMLIVVNNFLHRPAVDTKKQQAPIKTVPTYHIGKTPTMIMQAQVEKSNLITIAALAPGIVQEINVTEGQTVARGTNLLWFSTNYQGGNTFSLQRQLAATQYTNAKETYDIQKDLIAKQRDIAEKVKSNASELRDITSKSIDDMKSLISLNEDIVSNLDKTIADNEALGTPAGTAAAYGTKQLKSQILAGLNQARMGLRQAEYQVNTDKPPAQLEQLQKDVALRQLDLQEKMLNMSLEVSRIQLLIAQNAEAMMHPVAPFSGTIQKIHVRLGQQINPGAALVTFAGDGGQVTATIYAPADVVQKASQVELSKLFVNQKIVELAPYYVSQEATQGSLYALKYVIPSDIAADLADKSYIKVEVPIGYADTTAALPFVPVDSVYQSKNDSYVYIAERGTVKSKKVTLGNVYGDYVAVDAGLSSADAVIIDRSVVAGDRVKTLTDK